MLNDDWVSKHLRHLLGANALGGEHHNLKRFCDEFTLGRADVAQHPTLRFYDVGNEAEAYPRLQRGTKSNIWGGDTKIDPRPCDALASPRAGSPRGEGQRLQRSQLQRRHRRGPMASRETCT